MFRKMKAGSTSQSVPIFIKDTTKTDGSGLGSLVFNTAGLAAKYRRQGDNTWTVISLQTMTLGTWASGGFIADGGPVTGGYEVGLPNAVLASSAGVTWAEIMIYGATNMLPVLMFIELDQVDYQNATSFGLVNLSNAVPTTAQIAAAVLTDTSDVNTVGSLGYIATHTPSWYGPPTTAQIATAVWTDLTTGSDFNTVNSIGKLLAGFTAPPTVAQIATGVWQDTTAGDFTVVGSIGKLLNTFTFTGSNVNANAQVVSDKTGYSLTVTPPTAAQIATTVWQDLTAGSDFTTAGSIGKLLATFTFTGTNVNADALVVGDKTGYSLTVTPPTTAQIATAVWTDLTAGSDFQTVGSIGKLLATSGGTVTVGGYVPGQDPATLVLDVAASLHNTAGTIGNKINSAGAAGDPLVNFVPGNYARGTAGDAIGRLLGANVTVFAPVAANGDTTITRGDDYLNADGRALLYLDTNNLWADNSTAVWKLFRPGSSTPTLSITGTITPATGTGKQLIVELPSATTAALTDTTYRLAVVFTRQDGHVETNIAGTVTVNP